MPLRNLTAARERARRTLTELLTRGERTTSALRRPHVAERRPRRRRPETAGPNNNIA
jgi:hypothetical protein